jgi:HAD superfamily hydrolase (TIGR01509 family)
MPAIYETFLAKFSLQAEECVFIDDLPGNIAGGMTVGMQGLVFRGDVNALREQLDELLDIQ